MDLDRLIDPSWLETTKDTGTQDDEINMSRACFTQLPVRCNTAPAVVPDLTVASSSTLLSPASYNYPSKNISSPTTSPMRGFRARSDLRELTISDLKRLYKLHSFEARLILEALQRKLKYLRDDCKDKSHSSMDMKDPASQRVFVDSLYKHECMLSSIRYSFFSVDGKRHIGFADEFYVGFWDAWSEIHAIALLRLTDEKYLTLLQTIEDARLDLYFPNRHEPSMLLDAEQSDASSIQGSDSSLLTSLDQSELYSSVDTISSVWGSEDFTPHRNTGSFADFLPVDCQSSPENKIFATRELAYCSGYGHQRYEVKEGLLCGQVQSDRDVLSEVASSKQDLTTEDDQQSSVSHTSLSSSLTCVTSSDSLVGYKIKALDAQDKLANDEDDLECFNVSLNTPSVPIQSVSAEKRFRQWLFEVSAQATPENDRMRALRVVDHSTPIKRRCIPRLKPAQPRFLLD